MENNTPFIIDPPAELCKLVENIHVPFLRANMVSFCFANDFTTTHYDNDDPGYYENNHEISTVDDGQTLQISLVHHPPPPSPVGPYDDDPDDPDDDDENDNGNNYADAQSHEHSTNDFIKDEHDNSMAFDIDDDLLTQMAQLSRHPYDIYVERILDHTLSHEYSNSPLLSAMISGDLQLIVDLLCQAFLHDREKDHQCSSQLCDMSTVHNHEITQRKPHADQNENSLGIPHELSTPLHEEMRQLNAKVSQHYLPPSSGNSSPGTTTHHFIQVPSDLGNASTGEKLDFLKGLPFANSAIDPHEFLTIMFRLSEPSQENLPSARPSPYASHKLSSPHHTTPARLYESGSHLHDALLPPLLSTPAKQRTQQQMPMDFSSLITPSASSKYSKNNALALGTPHTAIPLHYYDDVSPESSLRYDQHSNNSSPYDSSTISHLIENININSLSDEDTILLGPNDSPRRDGAIHVREPLSMIVPAYPTTKHENTSNGHVRPTPTEVDVDHEIAAFTTPIKKRSFPTPHHQRGTSIDTASTHKSKDNTRSRPKSQQLPAIPQLQTPSSLFNLVNTTTEFGVSPLHLAIAQRNIELSHILIACGGYINALTNYCTSPLMLAIQCQLFPVIETLLRCGADTEYRDVETLTAICYAIFLGRSDIVQLLCHYNANVHLVDSSQSTLPHLAAMCGNKDTMIALFEAGCDVNAVDLSSRTPFYYACSNGNTHLALVCIEYGAEVRIMDEESNISALHYAARFCKPQLVATMIKLRADTNALTVDGETPLMWAIEEQQLDVIKLLIHAGADYMNITNSEGMTAFDYAYAICPEHSKVLSYFESIHISADAPPIIDDDNHFSQIHPDYGPNQSKYHQQIDNTLVAESNAHQYYNISSSDQYTYPIGETSHLYDPIGLAYPQDSRHMVLPFDSSLVASSNDEWNHTKSSQHGDENNPSSFSALSRVDLVPNPWEMSSYDTPAQYYYDSSHQHTNGI